MGSKDLICFDFETGGRNPHKCQPTQIAAIAIDGRTLRAKGSFNSEIKPILDDEKAIALGLDPVEDEALKITKKTREELANAPELKLVWSKFVDFVNKYNWKGQPYFAPIACGYNIIGFDMIIVNRLCKEYGPYNENRQQQALFHQIHRIDMLDNIYMWTEADPSVKSRSLDTLRERMGLSGENAHDALQDVKDTANIMIKFLKTHRAVYRNLKVDAAFADGSVYIK